MWTVWNDGKEIKSLFNISMIYYIIMKKFFKTEVQSNNNYETVQSNKQCRSHQYCLTVFDNVFLEK